MPTIKKHNNINLMAAFCRIALTCILFISLALIPLDATAKTKSQKNQKSGKQSSKNAKPYNPPYAHIVIDATTGEVLSQSDADRALYPASLAKIMTLLLTFEAVDSKRISLNSSVVFSPRATNMAPSRIGLKAGQSMSVDQAIRALVTKSANDVAYAVAEKVAGSEDNFAQMMNLKARQIGMSQTHFENASGLNNVRQVSSARDMAKLSMYMMRTYPHYYKYFSLREFSFNGQVHKNHNKLMSKYPGMDGLKTGYIAPSGFNLVASAKRGNKRLIGVVFGGKSANSRNEQMAKLLDDGFAGRKSSVVTATLPPVTPAPQLSQTSKAQQPNQPQGKQVLTHKIERPTQPQSTTSYLQKPTISKPQQAGIAQQDTNMMMTAPTAMTTLSSQQQAYQPANQPADLTSSTWAIQIGAYQDRIGTDQALYRALKSLPAPLNRGTPQVIPLRTSDSTWMFRARIAGYTREQANKACTYLKDCLAIAPSAN